MTTLAFRRTTQMPTTPEANTVYLVKQGSEVRMYVSTSGPSPELLPVNTASEDLDEFLFIGGDSL